MFMQDAIVCVVGERWELAYVVVDHFILLDTSTTSYLLQGSICNPPKVEGGFLVGCTFIRVYLSGFRISLCGHHGLACPCLPACVQSCLLSLFWLYVHINPAVGRHTYRYMIKPNLMRVGILVSQTCIADISMVPELPRKNLLTVW